MRPEGADVARRIAAAGHGAARARLRLAADAPGSRVRHGDGWLAVVTGVDSNSDNGVVSEGGLRPDAAVVADLATWFRAAGVPASWLAARPDPVLTEALVAAGAVPERTGHWAGRELAGAVPDGDVGAVAEIRRVTTTAELTAWLDVAEACGWVENPDDRAAVARLSQGIGLGHPDLASWVAWAGSDPVAMATTFHASAAALELVDVAVLEAQRRRGIGRAVVAHAEAEGRRRGAGLVVTAPSPEGWELFRACGFVSVPVEPDVAFYLP
ncbi:GCN5-related protein N-acetyltransferase [Beutenbergia cavernae DSM 12333]|uniref:GCN5-related protein N-acetyltransferase n=1 Tax=Beutenbergia cavernae (strain ATCC BAA-8 / DSM 12333 / CCUG 43141 / JCM 11478 / NBRC 16432 / NCIMB 13614 / HKI 0122) TaxID=471853 RepID=C5C4A4_BEUC1|nr:GNAT family N-acetyltransferase [Beutenbergia cavernae]ACQ82028.1 GCN5-related protein N-acetyltransferase [Beutenbergia cavernae DSM 12333]